jgi:peptidoglycan/LPS O-acetylase OafA/YrhL
MRRTVGSGPLVTLGRYSLVLYLWHYPLFWYVAKLDTSWGWRERTTVAYALTLAFAVLATVLIERPLQRWLRADGWHVLDRGVAPAVAGAVRRPRRRAAHAGRRPDRSPSREESGV